MDTLIADALICDSTRCDSNNRGNCDYRSVGHVSRRSKVNLYYHFWYFLAMKKIFLLLAIIPLFAIADLTIEQLGPNVVVG